MEVKEQYLKILNIAEKISNKCDAELFISLRINEKITLSTLYFEAFRTFLSFKLLIDKFYLSQSASILRMLIDETARLLILEKEPNLYKKFLKHRDVRKSIIDLDEKEQDQTIIKQFNLNKKDYKNHKKCITYLDYNWAIENGGYYSFLNQAFGEENNITNWVKLLEQFIHQNINSLDLYDEGKIRRKEEFIYIGCVTFERLYISFHKTYSEKHILEETDKIFLEKYRIEFEKMLNIAKEAIKQI